jgi:hypothetical protein
VVRRATLTGADRAGGAIVAWGPKTVALSRNSGTTWSRVRTPKGSIDQVDFVNRRRGYLVQQSGRLYATVNGGRTWRARTAVGRGVDQIAFGTPRSGYALGAGGFLATTDSGKTWQPQLVGPSTPVSVVAPTGGSAMAAGGAGSLFGTVTGGRLGRASRLVVKVSKRRLGKPGTVRVTGKLTPASPGSNVSLVLRRGVRYTRKSVVVASTGAFSGSFRVAGASEILAQWRGDDRLDGDGTAAVKVTVKNAKKRKRRR